MIAGFDVDGVISKVPLRLKRLIGFSGKWWNRLLSTSLGRFFYDKFRYIDKETRDVLYQLRDNGHQIIIATYVFEKYRGEVEKWLRKNEVPFDKLLLAEEKESPLEFKVRAILSEGCDYFVEDQSTLAQNISREVSGVHVIYYQKKEDLGVLLEQN